MKFFLTLSILLIPLILFAEANKINSSDLITTLEKKLNASGGLWLNGISRDIELPANTPIEKVATKWIQQVGYDNLDRKNFTILDHRPIEIDGKKYQVVRLKTNLGDWFLILWRNGKVWSNKHLAISYIEEKNK